MIQESAARTEDILEKLSATLTGEELDTIEKLYHQAMKLEQEFYCSQPVSQKTVVPLIKDHNPATERLVLFSDFDLTCTVVDSSAILAEIAMVRAPKPDQTQPDDQITRMSSADLRNTWGVISRQYTEEYEECIDKITPPATGDYLKHRFSFIPANYVYVMKRITIIIVNFWILQRNSSMKICVQHLSNSLILRNERIIESSSLEFLRA